MLQLQISNSHNVKKSLLGIIVGAFFLVFITGNFSHAYALTVSPARIEIAGDPGATVGDHFALINEQSTTQTFYASYENFTAQGETGSPAFSDEKTGFDTWLNVTPEQVTLAPGQIMNIPYSIIIPKDADPGGYFAAIFWSTTPPSAQSGQVSIGAKVGVLVLLTVNGNAAESGGITQFDRNGHGFFYTTLPVSMRYKFRNEGADRVEPTGSIIIRDTLFLPSAHLDANTAVGNILPGSVRQFTVEWIKHAAPVPVQGFFNTVSYEWSNFAIGLYSAHLNLAYGTGGLHATKTAWFFVFPWQLLTCIFIILFAVLWIGKILLRRYNAYIIRQAQAGSQRDVDHT